MLFVSLHMGSGQRELERRIGLRADGAEAERDPSETHRALLLRLAAQGFEVPAENGEGAVRDVARDLFGHYAEQRRLLAEHLCPPDRRIQDFLDDVLGTVGESVRLPRQTVTLDRYGHGRELSLPARAHEYHNDFVSSYRLDNGVLHNPASDRRTTQGVFHVADFGLTVPADKIAVPLRTYAALLRAAFEPPRDLSLLPFTSAWSAPVHTLVSILLRPLVCPEVPGKSPEKRMEVRFFAPGGLVSNLDFVESIFGNWGDPYLPENDAALDVLHWTGHSGAVVLAPHLTRLRKKDVGLPHIDQANERQRAHGMCWADPHEPYNGGNAFKLTLRDMRGVMVTILADNYFGYCKKEIKTQISLSANLSGLAEEEHSGGALAFSTYGLGRRFLADERIVGTDHRFAEALELLGDSVTLHPEGYATDKQYPDVHLLPEDMEFDVASQLAKWTSRGQEQKLRILPGHVYLHPSGYKVRLEKHPAAPSWRLVGTVPEGTFCHKPCTVSGGGKSEISKSLTDALLYGPVHTTSFEADLALVEEIITKSYADCLRPELGRDHVKDPGRAVLSHKRSLGSVIKLLTPNRSLYTDAYNEWLETIPNHVRAIVFIVKRFYDASWGSDWKSHFAVDIVNGAPGHELKLDGRHLVGSYLRLGLTKSGAWRTYKLRQDFIAADKVQMEDDITASVVVPASDLPGLPAEYAGHPSLKLSSNCEQRLFQRPDDAIVPGMDEQTERDMARPGLFASNFAPLAPAEMLDLLECVDVFDKFTPEMQEHIAHVAAQTEGFGVCSARPRIVGGKPTKNPRYLQVRPDVARPRQRYVAELGTRLYRRLRRDQPVVFPVTSVLSGRRNNPPDQLGDAVIRPLCVYGPIHYQELPELFIDYICSVTGKSPSTTGAGSEGALTKGPFNAICATADLNNALVSMLLTGYAGFSSAAGYIGPDCRVDHDISLLIPEVWCRLFPEERDPARMIERGELEKLEDFDFDGRRVLASRLGYRITERFVHTYFGRIFDNPVAVFSEAILKPETQSLAVFADGVNNLTEAQERAAKLYFEDGSIDLACPPIRALLHIMAHGHFESKGLDSPDVRALFRRDTLLASDWYRQRLVIRQEREQALWRRHVAALEGFEQRPGYAEEVARLGIRDRLELARRELERASSPAYLAELVGTIGADPISRGCSRRS